MSGDPNSKTIRHFRCRDYLWDTFEEMGRELGCSTDYLINEAMRLYARSREYGTHHPSIAPQAPASGSAPNVAAAAGRTARAATGASGISPAARPAAAAPPVAAPAPPPTRSSYMPPPPGPGALRPPAGAGAAPTAAFDRRRPSAPDTVTGQTAPVGLEAPRNTMLRQGAVAPPPSRSSLPAAPPMVGGAALPDTSPRLTLLFQGERIPVDKTEFVIGRGSKSSDLAIKDGNISRRHAAVVFERGAYWLRDLGSTNGIEHAGRRIDQKRIEEGDVFQICDYELRFTYR